MEKNTGALILVRPLDVLLNLKSIKQSFHIFEFLELLGCWDIILLEFSTIFKAITRPEVPKYK